MTIETFIENYNVENAVMAKMHQGV